MHRARGQRIAVVQMLLKAQPAFHAVNHRNDVPRDSRGGLDRRVAVLKVDDAMDGPRNFIGAAIIDLAGVEQPAVLVAKGAGVFGRSHKWRPVMFCWRVAKINEGGLETIRKTSGFRDGAASPCSVRSKHGDAAPSLYWHQWLFG